MAIDSTGDATGYDLIQQLGLGEKEATVEKTNELGKNAFLELMAAQMQNQDPLNPTDNTEMIAQMAQFSQAEGIQNLQESFDKLANAITSQQTLSASTVVGRTVLVAGDTADLAAGGNIEAAVELDKPSQGVLVNIFNGVGEKVRTLDLGAVGKGGTSFSWDGTQDNGEMAYPGFYKIEAIANYGGATEGANTLIGNKVNSVSIEKGSNNITLNLDGQGKTPFSAIRQIM